MILAVGSALDWHIFGRDLPSNSQISFAEFRDVNRELLCALAPDIIISPLFAKCFDCLDLAVKLESAKFAGLFQVLSPSVPKPKLIMNEIKSCCPTLRVTLIPATAHQVGRVN